MAIRVTHEIHERRRSRNVGLLIVLLGFVGIVFGLTMAKVTRLGDAAAFEGYDHVVQPALAEDAETPAVEGASE